MKKYIILSITLVLIITCLGLVITRCSDDDKAVGVNSPKILLYSTSAAYTGKLAGRTGADDKCKNDANKPADAAVVHALISVTADDNMTNMPSRYDFPDNIPLVAAIDRTTVIADDWADLTDGSIDVSLNDSGVLLGDKSNFWWSGTAKESGGLDTYNCNGWDNELSSVFGEIGNPGSTNFEWSSHTSNGCDNLYRLICIAY